MGRNGKDRKAEVKSLKFLINNKIEELKYSPVVNIFFIMSIS